VAMQALDPKEITVVVVNSYCHVQGGASRVAIDSAIGLADVGFQVIFLGAIGPVCTELLECRAHVICLQQRDLSAAAQRPGVALQGLWNVAAYKEMKTLLSRLDPSRTIVHVHGFTQALSSSPTRAATRAEFKVVFTLHDFFVACPNGAFFDYVSNTPCLRRALSLDCITTNCDKRRYAHKVYRVARSLVQMRFGTLPGGVKDYIGLSRHSTQVLRPYLPRDAHIHLIGNPVPVAKAPAVDVLTNRAIVFIGRLDAEKGIEVLLKAAAQADVPITFVGDGPLRERAEAGGLCRVTGWISRDLVIKELESARCLVFPSVWYETFGLVVDEAAARGVPAIVSDNSAAAERVVDGVTGWHVRAGDVVDLVRCLCLVQQGDIAQSVGSAAYHHWWSDPLTLDKHILQLTGLYNEMLLRDS
jgi:glycosyltransferase involved in cell wall biosynthesis